MPTQNRRKFIPRAIDSFLIQDWPEKELIVVDSGTDRAEDLIKQVPNAKYIFYTEPRPEWLPNVPIGTKRNIACENASGEIICHWDDDDYSYRERIGNQVGTLIFSGKSVTGYNRIKEETEGVNALTEYAVPDNMACGTSFCYWKSWWKDHKFKHTSFGEDWMFAEEALEAGQLATTDGRHFMRTTVHSGNTSLRA